MYQKTEKIVEAQEPVIIPEEIPIGTQNIASQQTAAEKEKREERQEKQEKEFLQSSAKIPDTTRERNIVDLENNAKSDEAIEPQDFVFVIDDTQ